MSAKLLARLTTSGINQLVQYAISTGNKTYRYTELAVVKCKKHKELFNYRSYSASNFSPHTSKSPGHSCGHIRVQSSLFSTRLMNRSGIQRPKNRSRARCSSEPVFFRQSRNWKMSACHGSR